MPELPEVETIRRQLENFLVGHKILDVEVKYPKVFEGKKEDVVGGKILKVRRFAKVLSIDLSNGNSIVIHIKLTGQLIYRGSKLKNPPQLSKKIAGGIPSSHTYLIFKLDKDGFLYYNDVRKFGWVKIIQSSKLPSKTRLASGGKAQNEFLAKLGPEPQVTKSSPGQAVLTFRLFKKILSKSQRAVKVVLMDQEKIGGIGNIYANDALWLAKINPKTPARQLDKGSAGLLYQAILEVLKEGLKRGGASEISYVTPAGKEGEYQKHFLAYGQDGKLCPRCKKSRFTKTMLAGRGTYFCPVCQK